MRVTVSKTIPSIKILQGFRIPVFTSNLGASKARAFRLRH